MSDFYTIVSNKIIDSINNNYVDNYDEERFGPAPVSQKSQVKEKVKKIVFKERLSTIDLKYSLPKILTQIANYGTDLELLYNALNDDDSKTLLIDLIAFRILGNSKVKLRTNNIENAKSLLKIKAAAEVNDFINPNFMHFSLYKFDLNAFGKDIRLYFTSLGILVDFFMEQYKYINGSHEILADKDDIVIDAGGCWGDTALYFADRIGKNGKVYSFEFIPNNLAIFKKNRDLNPRLKDQITVVEKPVWNTSGEKVYYKDFGPGSKVDFEDFNEADGSTETISIDDFVFTNDISKINFIKMDIEGSELPALKGAKKTIEKYKPKLAIAIYHSWEDFIQIPKWILDLDLGYKIYLGHYTIHAEETVIFATTK